MRHRLLATGLPTVVIAMMGMVSVSLTGQAPGPGQPDYTAPRTPWGDPDLQGMWDTRTYTPFERPAEFGTREFMTEEEVVPLKNRCNFSPV